MIRALIFDCFGVVLDIHGVHRDEPLLGFITASKAKYDMALLSNISAQGLTSKLPQADLDKYFTVVVASEEVGLAKPDPRIYELTANRLGVDPSECIMIDDREDHCFGAKAAGMQAVQYRNFEQFSDDIATLLADT